MVLALIHPALRQGLELFESSALRIRAKAQMDPSACQATVFKQSLPMMAVDKHSTCDEHEVAGA